MGTHDIFSRRVRLKRLLVSALIVFIFLNLLSRILFPGQILGLDYNLYHPDGICYTNNAYTFAGIDTQSTQKAILDKYKTLDLTYSPVLNLEKCEQLKGRILYPFFASLFVPIFGIDAMIVVSALSFLIGILFCYFILKQFTNSTILAMSLIAAISSSSTLLRWGISNLSLIHI